MQAQTANAMSKPDWRLESFIEALIFELDKAQDALSVKGINRKLTYTVKDVAVDLNVFPDYANDDLKFSVARPGDKGASRISFQLGSITDQQIRETTRDPVAENDIIIDEVEEIEPEIKEKLQKLGVKSARDLERMERRNVALPAIVARDEPEAKDKVSYSNLADIINRARRGDARPEVKSMALEPKSGGASRLRIEGENLEIGPSLDGFPMAMLNGREVDARIDAGGLSVDVPAGALRSGTNPLSVALDETVVLQLDLRAGGEA